MPRESRVKKSLLNARVNMMCYFVSLVVAFFSRKIFIDQLGIDFIGFTGTIQSLLGFLNLAELGVGTAIGYILYKPIFGDDKVKINEIISVFGYLYRCIGLVILGVGILLSCFLPFIFPDIPFSWGVIYFAYYSFLVSSLIGYFINYRQTLLSADQRNYVVTGYQQATVTTKVIIQMILAIYIRSFVLWISIELIFGIIYSIILNWRINQTYPWLESDVRLGMKLLKKYPEIGKYVKQLFVHKIATFIQFQIIPFLIYSYVSLPVVAIYGNYTLVTARIQSLMAGVMDSSGAGVGNLISEGNKEKILRVYHELFALRAFVSGVLSGCIYYLISPFISLWLGNEYVLSSNTVFLIAFVMLLMMLRGTTDQFIFGYGLFYDVWAPLVESAIFIIASVTLGSYWGLSGILCGPILSLVLIVYIWKPYFLYSKGFKMPFYNYWILFFKHLLIIPVAYWGIFEIMEFIHPYKLLASGWYQWIEGAGIFTMLFSVLLLTLYCLVSTGMRMFIFRIIKLKR